MSKEILQALLDIKRTIIVLLKDVWSVADLALILDKSESRIRHLVAKNLIPSYKQNGNTYFHRPEIEAWLTSQRTPSQQDLTSIAQTRSAARRIKTPTPNK